LWSCDGRKPQSFRSLPIFSSGFFSRNSINNLFLSPVASLRIGTRSNGCFSFFGGLLAMTLTDLTRSYSTDEQCRALLKKLRWPNGVECLRCKNNSVNELSDYAKFECRECGYQFSVTTQTIFHDTHLALEFWFMAALLLCEARKGMSASQLKRTLWGQNKGSYKTAWYLCHRIRKAMAMAERPMLDGVVEMDETYIGGRKRGMGRGPHGKGKEIVVGIRQRGGDVRFFRAEDAKSGTLAKYIKENISKDVECIVTDDFKSYPAAIADNDFSENHFTVNHSMKEYVNGEIHTNTVENAFSLLKRGIVGTWHKISAKHLPAYLAEMEFRFNRRKNPDLFIDTLRHMITADPLTFDKLTA
jgi:transposase-like protein